MKTNLFRLAIASTFAVWAPAIAQETAPAIAAPAPDNSPFEWRLRLKAGQKFRVTTETTMENSQQMPAMPGANAKALPPMQMTTKNRLVMEQNVVSSDEKGARIETIYREVSDSSRMMQGDKVVYDSAQPPAGMDEVGEMSQKMVGAKLSYLLSPQGKISDIRGIEEYLKQIQPEGQNKESPQVKAARASVAGFFSPEMVKESLGQAYEAFPSQPVKIGETWNHTSTLPIMGTTLTTDTQNRFVSRANGLILIAQTGQFSSDAGAQLKLPVPASGKAAPISQMDLQGTSTGEIQVDEQSGLIVRSQTVENIAGEMIMSGLTGKGSVLTLPMTMKMKTTVSLEEIKTTP